MEDYRNALKFLIGKSVGKRLLGRLRCRWKVNVSCRSRNQKDELDPRSSGQESMKSFRECDIDPLGFKAMELVS